MGNCKLELGLAAKTRPQPGGGSLSLGSAPVPSKGWEEDRSSVVGPAWPGQGLAVPVLCRKVSSGQPELPQPFQPPFGAGEASSAWGQAGVGSLLSQAQG